MAARHIFTGRNIVLTLLAALLYLILAALNSPDSTLSQILNPKATPTPTIVAPVEEDIIEEHEPDVASESSQDVAGTVSERQVATVTKVVDGDTIGVLINEKSDTIRIIGLNTPETVDPRRGVQCFGREASNFAKQTLTGKIIFLESDPSQAERDRYGRLLRFVFLEDGTDFGKLMISEGYGYEYTYDLPYKYQRDYKNAQRDAQTNKKGLWADNAC